MNEKEQKLVQLAAAIEALVADEPCDVAVGALGLALVGLMEVHPFDHKIMNNYLDEAAKHIKEKMN